MAQVKKTSKQITLLIVILALGIFLFYGLIQFFTAFLGSVIFYVLTKGFMSKLTTKFKFSKSLAAIVVIILSFFIILLPISLFVTLLYGKLSSILQHPTQILDTVKSLDALVKEKTKFSILSPETIKAIPTYATQLLGLILNTGVTAVSSILMMYFFLYFMLTSPNMEEGLITYLPFDKKHVRVLGEELVQQTISNSLGIPLIAVAQGLIGYLAYLIGGLPEPGFWGVLTGFASIIPVVGSGLIYVPVTIYLLATHHIWQGITVFAICAVVLSSMDNIIRFVLAKKMADVHPIITILGVIVGLKYFGISGLVFGPLLISYFFIFYKMYYNNYLREIDDEPLPLRVAENVEDKKEEEA